MRYVFAVLLLSAMASCSRSSDPRKEADDIREAVFRYQFDRSAFVGDRTIQIRFLSFENAEKKEDLDPSDAFMARFREEKPRVAKQSMATPASRRA